MRAFTPPELGFTSEPGPLFIEDHPWLLDPDGDLSEKTEYYTKDVLPNKGSYHSLFITSLLLYIL